LFALPLLVFYQVLAVLLAHGERSIRNGADAILQSCSRRGRRVGPAALHGLSDRSGIVARHARHARHGSRLRGGVFAAMLGRVDRARADLRLAVGSVTSGVLGMLQTLAPGGRGHEMDWWTRLMVSLGAGSTRSCCSACCRRRARRRRSGPARLAPPHRGIAATVAGAAIFSAFHYIGPYGDRWELYSFAFRMVAGLFFSGLYSRAGLALRRGPTHCMTFFCY